MDIKLPNLGEGADSGSVVNLLVKEGEDIQKGQPILELENEKAVAPIPSPASGKITKILVKEGDKLTVGQVILSLEETAEAKPTPAPKPSASSNQQTDEKPAEEQKESAPESEGEDAAEEAGQPAAGQEAKGRPGLPPAAAPTIRRLARDLGIDLGQVRGSERGGRIVMTDLRAYIERLQKAVGKQTDAARAPKSAGPPSEGIDFAQWGPIEVEPLSATRRTISRRMLESWTTIPHVSQFASADITDLSELRKKYGPVFEEKQAHLTMTPLILKAVAAVLQKFPRFNSSLREESGQIVLKRYYHLGLAVDTQNGLLVPVIRDVDKKSLIDLAKEVGALAGRARDRKIALPELKGGTFTISNQGSIGGGHFTPIINKPEVAILGVGKASFAPTVRGEKMISRMLLPLSLSYDHRVIDGGEAARFSVALVEALENFPEEALSL